MKKILFLLLLLPLLERGLGGGLLSAQTVSNLQVSPGAAGSASTVTFDVEWVAASLTTPWLDSMWVFVDYNKNGKMTRLLISGGTLTEHSATKAGTGIFIPENDMGAWVYGDARYAGSFSAKVQLYTKETDIIIAGACAYASSYPPVGNWIDDTKIGFTGTPGYIVTLTPKGGGADETVVSGSTFLLPCSYTVSSFTDATGAPGIPCLVPSALSLTASPETICPGESATLTASATGAVSYSLDGSSWQAEAKFKVTPSSTTAHTLYAQTVEGCVATLPNVATVTVNPLPDDLLLTAVPTTICKDGSATLTASATGGVQYCLDGNSWGTSTTFSVSPPSNASYTLYVKTTEGCTVTLPDAATVTVTQKGGNDQPSTPCGCATGTVNCSGTCKTDANYTTNNGACTSQCRRAYVQSFDACGNLISAQAGTYAKASCTGTGCNTQWDENILHPDNLVYTNSTYCAQASNVVNAAAAAIFAERACAYGMWTCYQTGGEFRLYCTY